MSRLLPVSFSLAAVLASLLAGPAGATMPPRSGVLPPEVLSASRDGLFQLPARPEGLPVSAVQPLWRIPVILVSYSDDSLHYPAADFDIALFDSTGSTATGSVYDYYRWASGGRLRVLGRVIATVHLPHDKFYYGYNSWGLSRISTPNNAAGLVHDAISACASQVHWSDFDLDGDGFVDMLWVVHAGIGGEASPNRYENDLWSITSRLGGYWANSGPYETDELLPGSITQHYRLDRFSILPELSAFAPGQRSEIGVFCHEFGHALGLPDLYDTRDGGILNVGPGDWSLMSTGVYGGDGHSPQFPTHVGAWPSLFLGWSQSVRPTADTTMVLPGISDGGAVLELWFQGESNPEHFLVETRFRQGFDRQLPADGLIVYHVDDAVIGQGLQTNTVNAGLDPGLLVVEAAGTRDLTTGLNRGDAGDPFPGALGQHEIYDLPPAPNCRTFSGAPTNVGLFEITLQAGGVRFRAQVIAAGWLPAADRTIGEFAPLDALTPAATAVLAGDGTASFVASELRSGHQQIVLRTRGEGVWDGGVQLSSSSGDAIEPSIALLPGGDLAVVWSDTRPGRSVLYYRARVAGVWTPESALASPPGESRTPALAADARGGVSVAWLTVDNGQQRVLYMRFPYLSPFGQPWILSPPAAIPANIAVTPIPSGGCYVIWSEHSGSPSAIRFVRCAPDSAPGPPLPLTRTGGREQNWASAFVDREGTLHSLWIESGAGVSELHYQRRTSNGLPSLPDTTLEVSGSTLQNAQLTGDRAGGLHVVCERVVDGISQVRYRRRHPTLGWDARSTDLTSADQGAAVQPRLLCEDPARLTVLYTGFTGQGQRLMERQRTTDLPAPLVAVERPVPARAAPVFAPNPVRAGQAVELRWPAAGGRRTAVLEVFDLSGRRVGSVPLSGPGAFWQGRLEPATTSGLASGVYFARVRGEGATQPVAAGAVQRLVVLR